MSRHLTDVGSGRRRVLIAGLVALLVGGAFATAWVSLVRQDRRALEVELTVITPQIAGRLSDFIGARLLVADTLRRGMQDLGWDEQTFRAQSSLLRTRFRGFLALSWIDSGGTIRWVTPREPNAKAVGNNVLLHPEAGPYFKRAQAGQDVATAPLQLFQGMRGFATYLPIDGADSHGYVNGVFDIDTLVREALDPATLGMLRLDIRDGAQLVWRSAEFDQTEDDDPVQKAMVPVLDRSWHLRVRPGPAMRAAHDRGTRAWLLAATIALPLLVGSIVLLLLTRAAERAQYERAERRHAAELAEARRIEGLARMAAGVAHDFNNVLTAIIGSVSLARFEGPTETAELLNVIEAAAERGTEMTQQLLSYASKTPTQLGPLALGDELRDLDPILQRMVGPHVRLQVDASEGLSVRANRVELQRVLMNLVVNASEAMPDGGEIAITARLSEGIAGSPPGRWVELRVVDQGVGMANDVREHIFEPFFTTKGGGHGLGLATVEAAVRRLGGHLTVESELDKGTRFRIWLPLAEAA